MSVGIVCDECGAAVSDFALPQKFGDEDGTVVAISIEHGRASLDLCRRCFAEMLVSFACAVAPAGISYERKAGWERIESREEKDAS